MKALALDLGNKWIGTAISDSQRKMAFPLETIEINNLCNFLKKQVVAENITTIVVGLPITQKGNQGKQAKTTKELVEKIKKFLQSQTKRDTEWVFVDERYTSKGANVLVKHTESKLDKKRTHSIAASLILEIYLEGQ